MGRGVPARVAYQSTGLARPVSRITNLQPPWPSLEMVRESVNPRSPPAVSRMLRCPSRRSSSAIRSDQRVSRTHRLRHRPRRPPAGRGRRSLAIPRDEAMVLAQLVRVGRCVSICEIGTSYGFSTLHLAAAAREHGGHVHSIDRDPRKIRAAGEQPPGGRLERGGEPARGRCLGDTAESPATTLFDLVFIDAAKSQCDAYLDAAWGKLAPSCMLVTDNTTTHAEELASFIRRLRELPGFASWRCRSAMDSS